MRRFVLFLVLFGFLVDAGRVSADASAPVTDSIEQPTIARLLNHNINYDLGFLWLDKVAVANFKLQKSTQPGMYIASLSAKMVGIAATLTNNRKQQYVSLMKLMPDGSFRSVRHTSQIEKGGTIRTKVFLFDYDKRVVTYQYFKNNKKITETEIPIKGDGNPGDVLTIYFNLLAGTYGPMEPGAHYEVPAFDRKEIGNVYIDFLPADKRPLKNFFDANLLICQVKVDQEVFDTNDGIIYVGYDANRLPVRGIVTDIIGMGDVRGIMK